MAKKPYYPILEAEIAKKGLVKKEIAEELKIEPRTFSLKLSGKREFRFSEILSIRKHFPEYSIEELFNHTD